MIWHQKFVPAWHGPAKLTRGDLGRSTIFHPTLKSVATDGTLGARVRDGAGVVASGADTGAQGASAPPRRHRRRDDPGGQRDARAIRRDDRRQAQVAVVVARVIGRQPLLDRVTRRVRPVHLLAPRRRSEPRDVTPRRLLPPEPPVVAPSIRTGGDVVHAGRVRATLAIRRQNRAHAQPDEQKRQPAPEAGDVRGDVQVRRPGESARGPR